MSIQGERIRILRNELGITQEQLAKACGYKTNTVIALVENGERELSRQKLRKCAAVLGTTIDYLWGETDNPSRPKSQDIIDKQFSSLRNKVYDNFIGKNSEIIMDLYWDLSIKDRKRIVAFGDYLQNARDVDRELIDLVIEHSNVNEDVIKQYLDLGKKLFKK